MPIYEYKCSECNTKFEMFYKSTKDETKPVCPKCKSEKVSKVLSKVNAKVSGVGVYAKEYVDSSYTSENAGSCCSGGNCSCGVN